MTPIKETCEPEDSHVDPGKIPKIVEPRRKQATILLWTDLSISSMDRLNESTSSDHVRQVLADIFMLDNYRRDYRSAVVLDLFFHTLQFAKQEQFSRDKTSAFFSIIKRIFEMCIGDCWKCRRGNRGGERSKGGGFYEGDGELDVEVVSGKGGGRELIRESPFNNKDITHDHFKDLLVCHSVNRPPYSVALFSARDGMRITQHTVNTFFRHFDMYKYTFTPQVSLDLTLKYSEMPPTPPPQEAVDEDTNDDEVNSQASKTKYTSEYLEVLQEEFTTKEVSEFLQSEAKTIHDKLNDHMNRAAESMYKQISGAIVARTTNNAERKSGKLDV